MVKIRLARIGRKKHASYRIVVADSRAARDGRFVEQIGWYQPLNNKQKFSLDEEKALKWLKEGAQPSETMKSLLSQAGVMKKLHEHKIEQQAAQKARRQAKKADTSEQAAG